MKSDPRNCPSQPAFPKPLVADWRISFALTLLLLLVSNSAALLGAGRKGDRPPVPYIIGGIPAAPGAYPWMVAILQSQFLEDPFNAQFCAGTLIAPDWVLSAAHCFVDEDTLQTVLSASDLAVMVNQTALALPAEFIQVTRLIVHEDFNTNNNSFNNDIALLQLATAPAGVPLLPLDAMAGNPLAAPGTTGKIIGWGSRMWDDVQGTPFDFPVNLHEADLPLISNAECALVLSGVGINDTHLCAGFLQQGGVDTCAADSGGPIFVSDGAGGFLQVGITSFGVGCGLPNRPGVYTRMSSFFDWVQENIAAVSIVPHWGNGDGLVTDLIVFNTSATAPSDSEIVFRDTTGAEIPMGTIVASASLQELPAGVVLEGNRLQLPPLGIHTISTNGLGGVVSGSITLTSSGAVGAAIRFRLPGIGITGVGSSTSETAVFAPARRVGRLSTGVAVYNTTDEEITVDLSLKNNAGQEVANGQATPLVLAPRSQVARFIQQLFPNADTASFEGSICVTARSGRVAAVALELGAEPGEFTTLPVAPIR